MAHPVPRDGVHETRDDATAYVKPKPSPWNWLLLPAAILPLLSFFWNSEDPRLFGMPFFYWIQLAFVLLSSLCCGIVYLKTKSGRH